MKKTLQEMTSAELALKFYKAEAVVRDFKFEDEKWGDVWCKDYEDLATELNDRCKRLGLELDGDELSLRGDKSGIVWAKGYVTVIEHQPIAHFKSVTIYKAKEFHALLGYMIHKQ